MISVLGRCRFPRFPLSVGKGPGRRGGSAVAGNTGDQSRAGTNNRRMSGGQPSLSRTLQSYLPFVWRRIPREKLVRVG
jgi:hypothetical protein